LSSRSSSRSLIWKIMSSADFCFFAMLTPIVGLAVAR